MSDGMGRGKQTFLDKPSPDRPRRAELPNCPFTAMTLVVIGPFRSG
jgi:hypothetical protein